jgi:hypothetical protein
MVLVRFKNREEHKEVKMKLKEMKEFIEDLCYMIEERAEEDADFRGGRYREDYDDEREMMGGRYGYRRGGSSRSRM